MARALEPPGPPKRWRRPESWAAGQERASQKKSRTPETVQGRQRKSIGSRLDSLGKRRTSANVLKLKKEPRRVRYSERNRLRSAVNDGAADHRHRDRHLLDALVGHGEDVLRQDDEIGKLAGFD